VVYHAGLMIDPAIGALLAGAFALLFVSAALHKLLDREGFVRAFRAYGVVPEALARVALLVPLLELTVSAALLTAGARTGAAATGVVLLVTYAAAIAINLGRGRRDLACGCGGANDARPIAAWMVWRNLALAALLAATLLPWGSRPLGPTDALTIGAGTSVAALLYVSLDTLLGRVRARAAVLRGAS